MRTEIISLIAIVLTLGIVLILMIIPKDSGVSTQTYVGLQESYNSVKIVNAQLKAQIIQLESENAALQASEQQAREEKAKQSVYKQLYSDSTSQADYYKQLYL